MVKATQMPGGYQSDGFVRADLPGEKEVGFFYFHHAQAFAVWVRG